MEKGAEQPLKSCLVLATCRALPGFWTRGSSSSSQHMMVPTCLWDQWEMGLAAWDRGGGIPAVHHHRAPQRDLIPWRPDPLGASPRGALASASQRPKEPEPQPCHPRGQTGPGTAAPVGPLSLQLNGRSRFPGVSVGARSRYLHFQKNKGEGERSKSMLCVKLDYAWVAWILYNHRHDQT